MKIIIQILAFLGVMLWYSPLAAQNPVAIVDSLKIELKNTSGQEQRAKLMADLTWYYAMVNVDSAEVYGTKSIALAEKLGDSTAIAQALSDFAVVQYAKGAYDKTIQKYKEALAIRQKLKDSIGIASLHYKLGTAHHKKTQFDSAMRYYIKALKFYESSGNEVLANSVQSNIGALHFNQKNYDEAMKYFEKNIVFFKKNNEYKLQSNAMVNKASIQLIQRDTLGAQQTLLKSIELSKTINNIETLGSAYHNLSEVYLSQGRIREAKEALLQSLKYREGANMTADIASSKLTLAGLYNATGEYSEARALLRRLKPYYRKEHIKEKLATLYLQNIINFSSLKIPDSVLHYTTAYTKIQDEVYGENALKVTNELEEKYETEKKENQILQQRAQLAEKDLEVRQKNTLIYGGFGLALLLALLGYLIYKQQKLKNRQLKKESELQTALAKIETQNMLQEQRLRISRDLHDTIGSQLTFVTSSVDNLKYAFQGGDEKITERLGQISEFTTQTIYELRDTIWAMNKTEIQTEDLQVRIANFIENAGKATEGIEFSFDVGSAVTDYTFTSIQGMNIYRIIQEAVNNALKYANASQISVKMELDSTTEEDMLVIIKDNGIGFDENKIEAGNGLANIRKRARDLGGHLSLVSKNNEGTTIRVSF
jgi:signal transduction histidine kinase